MNVFARLEAACALAVERAFALAFPSALEPVQIARKLVAAFEAEASEHDRGGRRFTVHLHPADFARFEPSRAYLERQWTAMLGRIAERSARPQRAPEVSLAADAAVAAGTALVSALVLPEPERLALHVRKGLPPARVALRGALIVGRDAACDVVLGDPRVSRRHLGIELDERDGTARFRDLGSSNGTALNGRRAESGVLRCGDVLQLGDSEVAVEPEDAG
jgi:hypothetical protein